MNLEVEAEPVQIAKVIPCNASVYGIAGNPEMRGDTMFIPLIREGKEGKETNDVKD